LALAALAFALLAGFYWPRATTAGAWASVLVGVCWGVGCLLVVGESGGYTWPWAMYGIPLIFATGITVSLITRPPVVLSPALDISPGSPSRLCPGGDRLAGWAWGSHHGDFC
jgi:Na+/proline symporter